MPLRIVRFKYILLQYFDIGSSFCVLTVGVYECGVLGFLLALGFGTYNEVVCVDL